MKKNSPRKFDLIVVLGMHRSGTSVITHGLEMLGVDLGANLMPAVEGNNSRGFFEDLDIYHLNISMLKYLDLDWHHTSPVTDSQADDLSKAGFLLKAVDLLRAKIGADRPFGIKDPRLAKLTLFWKKVFEHCELDVGYVIAARNPISVAKSLSRRDGLDFEKSYLLWLDHIVTALIHTEGENRVVVDFDLLVENPAKQLGRVARNFNLSIDPAAISVYSSEFLDQKLRHNLNRPQDLATEPRIPEMVRELYSILRAGACVDQQLLLTREQIAFFENSRAHLHSSLVYVDQLNQAVTDRDGQLAKLNQAMTEREGQIVSLNQAVTDRDGQLAKLNQAMTEREGQIVSLNQAVTDRDGQLAKLNQAMTEREGQIDYLKQKISKLDERCDALERIVESAKQWQNRPWAARVFHRWREPDDYQKKLF